MRLKATPAIPVFLSILLLAPAAFAGQQPTAQSPGQTRSAGARWLTQHQNADGGWGSGNFGQRHLGSQAGAQTSDVATTALSVMALLRDAENSEAHRDSIQRGVAFVVSAVESSPDEGSGLGGPTGTQPQHKLGSNVDTHFAALLLGEVDERVGSDLYAKAQLVYDKVLTKVVAAQRADGSFDANGWAPVLSSSVAAQSLYKAHAKGKQVDALVLEKSDRYSKGLIDAKTGALDSSAGAGVELYAAASSLQGNRNATKTAKPGSREEAQAAADKTAERVRTETARMISGFGSVGGEEMLSYMMISDSLAEQRGDDWKHWQEKIAGHLSATQNADGSWSGHHCITSTPFVTAAAVMTLGAGGNIEAAAVRLPR
jgi:hypothetical protein